MDCSLQGEKSSSHDMINALAVAVFVWKRDGMAVQLNLNFSDYS
jgi:hypothetical protein